MGIGNPGTNRNGLRPTNGRSPQSKAIANRLGCLNVAGEAKDGQTLDEPPAKIYLTSLNAQIG